MTPIRCNVFCECMSTCTAAPALGRTELEMRQTLLEMYMSDHCLQVPQHRLALQEVVSPFR